MEGKNFLSAHGLPALERFLSSLNEFHNTLKFTASWSTRSVVSLGTHVYKKNSLLWTDLHTYQTR